MPVVTAKKEKKSPVKAATKRGVKYAEPSAVLRGSHVPDGPLTVSEAKDLIGWTEVDSKEEYALKDLYGKCVVLANSPTNRPFRLSLAERYANEMLRGKWAFNLESIVVDRLGHVQQGQHRLAGFIIAEQEREISPQQWGSKELVLETLLGFGASEAAETADTYDTGTKRSLTDVIYRRQEFGSELTEAQQKSLAKVLSGALRLVWLRVGGESISFAPHFPHSEATEFYKQHPDIMDSVKTIVELDKDKGISSLISDSYAAALHYLMAHAKSKTAAKEFWKLFASGAGLEEGNPILTLRNMLQKKSASGGSDRDQIVSLVVKAFLAYVAGEKNVTTKTLAIKKRKEGDSFVADEWPQLGGLDSTPPNVSKLTKGQQLLMSLLKSGPKNYAELHEASGLQIGQLGKMLMKETKQGKEYPDSLESKGFVKVQKLEEQPITFSLTTLGTNYFKK